MPIFTKGKWWVSDDGDNKIYANAYADGVLCVAEVKQINEDMFYRFDGKKILHYIAEKNANARLIAAAPEMYEALKEICENMPILTGASELDEFSKAIHKARMLLSRMRVESDV